ncbi:MAG: GIY-YIG nuclease family protein [Bacteroidia bacterium]
MNYYVYILKCSNSRYYTGVTNNLERRLEEHNQGVNKSCYTYNKRPLELMYKINFNSPTEAINWEKKIKDWSRNKKEALINENWEDLVKFSKKIIKD